MKIKLKHDRNVGGRRLKAGKVLSVGDDIRLGTADALVRIGAAEKVTEKTPTKATKASDPVKENK